MIPIATISEILKQADEIQKYLEITCSENIDECIQRGNDIAVYQAKTAKLLADAKMHKDKAVKESIIARLNVQLPPSVLKQLIDSTVEKQNYAVNWMDRLNSACVHHLDWLRTVISKSKNDQFNSRHL